MGGRGYIGEGGGGLHGTRGGSHGREGGVTWDEGEGYMGRGEGCIGGSRLWGDKMVMLVPKVVKTEIAEGKTRAGRKHIKRKTNVAVAPYRAVQYNTVQCKYSASTVGRFLFWGALTAAYYRL